MQYGFQTSTRITWCTRRLRYSRLRRTSASAGISFRRLITCSRFWMTIQAVPSLSTSSRIKNIRFCICLSRSHDTSSFTKWRTNGQRNVCHCRIARMTRIRRAMPLGRRLFWRRLRLRWIWRSRLKTRQQVRKCAKKSVILIIRLRRLSREHDLKISEETDQTRPMRSKTTTTKSHTHHSNGSSRKTTSTCFRKSMMMAMVSYVLHRKKRETIAS